MSPKQYIDAYIEAHESIWSINTCKSRRSRLRALGDLLSLEPGALHKELKARGKGDYTIKTTIVVVSAFYDWLVEQGHVVGNPFLNFKKKFLRGTGSGRNAYKKRIIGRNYSEVYSVIEKSQQIDSRTRAHLLFLLESGLRISESYMVTPDWQVVGKGQKRRPVYGGREIYPGREKLVSKAQLRKVLKGELDITPHDLRRLCATRLVDKGCALNDVCQIMGWSSLQTAMKYLQPKKDEELVEVMR